MRANNITGLSVVATFSGTPFLLTLSEVWPTTDDQWFFLIIGQWALYLLGSKYLNDRLCVLPDANVRNVTT